MPEPTRSICAPWVSLPDLPTTRPPLVKDDQAADDDAWEAVTWQASEMLYSLSGRQFSGPCESTVELREHRHCGRGLVAEAAFGAGVLEVSGSSLGVPARGSGRRGALVVALPGRPVTEVVSVLCDGEPLGYEVDLAAGLLWRTDGWPWRQDGSTLVTYRHGAMPPTGGVLAAKTLTLELAKAHVGDQSCALPQRVQTLSRQGVTVGFRDSFESLDSNRTGIWSIDAWIQGVNPSKMTAPPSVWSPDAARARRRVVGP